MCVASDEVNTLGSYFRLEVMRILNLPTPSSRTMALESTQPLTEISTRDFPGGKVRPERESDNLRAISELIF
jgi:hypothetical protein